MDSFEKPVLLRWLPIDVLLAESMNRSCTILLDTAAVAAAADAAVVVGDKIHGLETDVVGMSAAAVDLAGPF